MLDKTELDQTAGRVVVIACAKSRRSAMETVAAQLERRGVETLVVAGVERTVLPLLKASFRHGGGAAYLLCGSTELAGQALDRVVTAVEGNGVPAENIWSGDLDWTRVDSLTEQLSNKLVALGVSFDTGEDLAPPPKARTRSKTVVAEMPQPPPQMVARSMGVPAPDGPTSSGAVRISAGPPAPTPESMDDAARDVMIARGPVQRFLSSGAGLACAGAAVVLLGSLAFVLSTDDATDEGATVASAGAVVADSAAAERQPAPAVTAPIAKDEARRPEPVAVAPVPAEAAADVVDSADEIDDEPAQDAELEIIEAPIDAELPNDAAEVYGALTRQSIRALDILLIAPIASKKRGRRQITARMNFESAKAYCDELTIEGVTAWRLPGVGELGSLTRSNMLPNGRYWTATKADAFGTRRVVWNTHSKRMGSEPAKWRGGRVVCVRLQRPQDGGPT